jgi:hypothetical protein
MLSSRLVIAAILGSVAAQPEAQCNTEVMAVISAGVATSDASCAALAELEGCIARIDSRNTQAALEVVLSGYQVQMQDCTASPSTAAIRTERDAVEIAGREIVFSRTIRQQVNVHDLAAQVQNNTDALARTVEDMREETTRTLSVSVSSMSSQMLSLATAAASTAASLRGDQSSLAATTSNQLSASISTMLSASVSTTARMADVTQTLNSSIQVAITAANNAATPSVYVQWGQKRCTSPANNVAVRTLYSGIVYGSRHNDQGGGSTNLCLKNSAGAQGGVVQSHQDSQDYIVPLRRDHANYNRLPSNQNTLRARDNWVIPCAKCAYAKSCFTETGVAECPTGYHKMYTGYMFGGHMGHRGNNDRFCIDKNPPIGDYTSSQNWQGYVYPTMAADCTGPGLARSQKVVLACHKCCVQ